MSKDKFSLNFWPSFTDLMLSLVLIILAILGVFVFNTGQGEADIEKAQVSQEKINSELETRIGKSKFAKIDSWNDISRHNDKDVIVLAELNKQTISFSDKILFQRNEFELMQPGKEILDTIVPVIVDNIENIKEIRIEGHTDMNADAAYNLELGANRAIAVYNHVTYSDNDDPDKAKEGFRKIDPAEHLISISSYGKFKPVGRTPGEQYNRSKLQEANTKWNEDRNRRIEIILEYKYRK